MYVYIVYISYSTWLIDCFKFDFPRCERRFKVSGPCFQTFGIEKDSYMDAI